MPGIKDLVRLIAQGTEPDASVTPTSPGQLGVIGRLVAAGLSAPETILIGDAHLAENASAPRIVFVPIGSEFTPRAVVGNRVDHAYHSADDTLQRLVRSIRTDKVTFEVHVWGQADPPDPEGGDHDATQLLTHAILQTLQDLAPGCSKAGAGKWTRGVNNVVAGREFVFALTIDTPVLGTLLARVPPGTTPTTGVFLQPSDPSQPPELAATV